MAENSDIRALVWEALDDEMVQQIATAAEKVKKLAAGGEAARETR